MDRQTILLVMNADTSDAWIADVAEAAAQNEDHLSCMILGAAPALPIYAYGVPPYGGMSIPDNWDSIVNEVHREQKERAKAIDALLSRHGASGDVVSVVCAVVDMKRHVALKARVCDMAFVAPNLRDAPEVLREAAHGVLFDSPIGLRLNGSASQELSRIFVAWDNSEAAASAAHVALPFLQDAKEVMIACIDPVMTSEKDGEDPGTDAAAWLSHRGCNVTVAQYPSGGLEIGECIQNRAKEFGADLVVLGAYGHARMMEAVFGGTTRTMIEQTKLPILLAH